MARRSASPTSGSMSCRPKGSTRLSLPSGSALRGKPFTSALLRAAVPKPSSPVPEPENETGWRTTTGAVCRLPSADGGHNGRRTNSFGRTVRDPLLPFSETQLMPAQSPGRPIQRCTYSDVNIRKPTFEASASEVTEPVGGQTCRACAAQSLTHVRNYIVSRETASDARLRCAPVTPVHSRLPTSKRCVRCNGYARS